MKRTMIAVLLLCATAMARDAAMQHIPASLFFVANEGQWEEPFAFKAAVGNAVYYVTPSGMTMDIRQHDRPQRAHDPMDRFERTHEQEPTTVRGHALRFTFLNANPSPEIIGEDKLSSYSNYFLGRDSCKWRSFVGHYQTVRMKNVWPGIDVVQKVQSAQRDLASGGPEGVETLYRVQAGADAQQISIQIEGLDAPLRTDGQGNLLLQTSLGTVKEKAPFAYQIVNHRQVEVPVRYQVRADNKYSLSFEAFDSSQELVIDPLLYGTYLGGMGPDYAYDVTIDSQSNKAVAGSTEASDFPVTPGAYQMHLSQDITQDGFVTLLTASGDSLIFSTYFGARQGTSYFQAVAFDRSGSIYAGGQTDSPNWPLTDDAFDTVISGNREGVLIRLSPDGSRLELSSYIGASAYDNVWDIALDSDGLVYVCGETAGEGFPITANALFPSNGGQGCGFLTVYDPGTSSLFYSTFIPGNHGAPALDLLILSPGNLWVTGYTESTNFPVTPDAVQPNPGSTDHAGDGFLSLWNLNENRLVYSSYWGGSGSDVVAKMSIRNPGYVVLAGLTHSHNFPLSPNAFDTSLSGTEDAYVSVIDLATGSFHSTLLGGDYREYSMAVFADSDRITVVGGTASHDFPITRGAFDTIFGDNGQPSNNYDVFVSALDSDLSQLQYSTFLGGGGDDMCYEALFQGSDTVCIVGNTGSENFPITPGAFQTQNHGVGDGFLVGFALPPASSSIGPQMGLVPQDFSLTVYPNPFNSTAMLSFTLPVTTQTTLRLNDITGRVVLDLPLGSLPAGTHQVRLDMSRFASGSYVVQVKTPQHSAVRKIVQLH
jgi:hypothetical protein